MKYSAPVKQRSSFYVGSETGGSKVAVIFGLYGSRAKPGFKKAPVLALVSEAQKPDPRFQSPVSMWSARRTQRHSTL